MSDDPSKRRVEHAARTQVPEAFEAEYWGGAFERILSVVVAVLEAVGNSVAAVGNRFRK